MFIGGIDEAGRGSAVGPLVIAGISIDKIKIALLQEEGVCDSKNLSPKARHKLFPKIVTYSESIFICKIKPKTIDSFVNQKKLNVLEAHFMTIVADNLFVDKVILDACDINLPRFKNAILEKIKNKSITVYCFHKADQDNVVVAAASILAKVTRDREISIIEDRYSIVIGSGYPSDPKTKNFLRENVYNSLLREHIRFSWNPVKNIIANRFQTKVL